MAGSPGFVTTFPTHTATSTSGSPFRDSPRRRFLTAPNFWIPPDPEGYSPHGCVVLDFDGDTVWESYRVPNNINIRPRTQL